MARICKKSISSLAYLAAFAFVTPINPLLSAELWPNVGWARDTAPDKPVVFARLSTRRHRAADRPPTDEASEDNTVPTGATAAALASCDQGSGKSETLTLPGTKGEVKLDRCYRGREQLVCSLNALSREAKALVDDFSKIVDASYPSISNLDTICKITPDALSEHLQKASTFGGRFTELRNEYDRRINCAAKVEQSLREVSLADMPRSEDILKSMNDTLQGDMKDVANIRQRIFELAEKMDASQKAIAVIQKIHRTMCIVTAREKPAAPEKPATAQPESAQPVTPTRAGSGRQ